MTAKEVKAPFYPADEGLLRVLFQPQGPETLIDGLHRFPQMAAVGLPRYALARRTVVNFFRQGTM